MRQRLVQRARSRPARRVAQINAYLSQFDVWDRYDYNGDGNFNQPDRYIDHFQIIHAGEGEETGGGAQGTDAIWSHRWYAFYNNIGLDGIRSAQLRRHPHRAKRLLDRRLHRRARERRRRRVRARVRSRPRAARPVRHERQHRRRGELDRLLDAVLERLVRQHRHPGGRHRQQADPDERLREDLPRLVELRGRAAPESRRRPSSARPRPIPSRRSSSSCCFPTSIVRRRSALRTRVRSSTSPAPETTWTTG